MEATVAAAFNWDLLGFWACASCSAAGSTAPNGQRIRSGAARQCENFRTLFAKREGKTGPGASLRGGGTGTKGQR
jgi:hypothetical protein